MQIGVDQGYMPIQPIHYSHKIHSEQTKLNVNIVTLLLEFQTFWNTILNVCMNCHENIAEYNERRS